MPTLSSLMAPQVQLVVIMTHCKIVLKLPSKLYVKYIKYAHGPLFAVCFILHLVLADITHILQGYFTGTGAIIWLPQYQWSNPEEYG